MLLGFLKPDSGTTFVNGADTSTNADEARKQTGYIPENVNLYPYLSGIENLDYFCKLAGIGYSKIELSDILATCGLQQDVHNQKTETYSKGMRPMTTLPKVPCSWPVTAVPSLRDRNWW